MLAKSDRPITVPSAATATDAWLAARKAWFDHYFGCAQCRIYHRQPVQKRGQHPCAVGAELVARYNNEPIWPPEKKNEQEENPNRIHRGMPVRPDNRRY